MEPPFTCSNDPLERLLGLPGEEIDLFTDVLLRAWGLADEGRLAAGYALLQEHALLSSLHHRDSAWYDRLLSLWGHALDHYCSHYGPRW